MAWKVIGAMPGHDAIGRNSPAIYGPLPCKVWVPVKGEKYKIRKRAASTAKPLSISSDNEKAVQYARWLAARDGIALPDGHVSVLMQHLLTREGKKTNRAFSVTFHNTNGQPVIIGLPNWDFDPAPPVESVVEAETVFADLLSSGLSLLADALADVDTRESAVELEAA